MPFDQRLPIVNDDDGIWGDILLQYLKKEHYDTGANNADNGGHHKITVRAGTTAAGTAPIKLTSGTLMSTPETGAIEFNNDSLYFTITTGTNRKAIAMYDETAAATGDLYYRSSGGTFVRLAIGSTDQTLRVAGGLPAWRSGSGFGTATKTSGYTIGSTDTVIFADATSGNVTITLPAASGVAGYRFYVKRIDNSSNTCSVARTGGDTIDGLTSLTIDQQYTSIAVVSDGSAWYIL
jgi:hypothetical protein